MWNLLIKNSKYWLGNLSEKKFYHARFSDSFVKQKNNHNLLVILLVFIQQKKVNFEFSMSLSEFQETE